MRVHEWRIKVAHGVLRLRTPRRSIRARRTALMSTIHARRRRCQAIVLCSAAGSLRWSTIELGSTRASWRRIRVVTVRLQLMGTWWWSTLAGMLWRTRIKIQILLCRSIWPRTGTRSTGSSWSTGTTTATRRLGANGTNWLLTRRWRFRCSRRHHGAAVRGYYGHRCSIGIAKLLRIGLSGWTEWTAPKTKL